MACGVSVRFTPTAGSCMRGGWVRCRLVVRSALRGLVYSCDVSDVQQFDCVIFEQC